MGETEKDLDKELGKKIMGAWHDRAQATKDHMFETDPDRAVMRYPYDRRTMDILGPDEWKRRFSTPD